MHVRARARSNQSRTRVLERAILAPPVAGEYYFHDRLQELCLTRPVSPSANYRLIVSLFSSLEIVKEDTFNIFNNCV